MNERYFACQKCQVYIDAGYRWAYWQIEKPRHVILNEGVDVDKLLKIEDYWSPPVDEQNDWLCNRVLPNVRNFLLLHKKHGVIFLESDTVFSEESLFYNWREIDI